MSETSIPAPAPSDPWEEFRAKKAANKKAYREANRESEAARDKAYREANKEAVAARGKAYYEANKEAYAAKNKAYREANREAIKAKKRNHREANKDRLRAKERAYSKTRREKVPDYQIAYRLRRYGLSINQFHVMVQAQDGRCECCRTPFSKILGERPNVDHCHRTGSVRGILCGRCNMALGHSGDDLKILRGLVRYLERARKSEALCHSS